MNQIHKNLKIRLYPDNKQIKKIEENIHDVVFVWNKLLKMYKETYQLFKNNGYNKLQCNLKTFNTMLNIVKTQYPFLRRSIAYSLVQVYRDLIKAFNNFFKNKWGYPKFKSKRNKKQSFRIPRVKKSNDIYTYKNTLKTPKIGYIKFKTSKKYRYLLKTCEINNVTIKRENGKYYATVNIITEQQEILKSNKNIGIDLGLKNLATLSDNQIIRHVNVEYEDKMIKKYSKKLSRQQYNSNRYKKTLSKLHKWIDKKKNKINDAYHKFTKYLVESFNVICMEDLNIKGMFKHKNWGNKLQRIGLYKIAEMLRYKCNWYGKNFIQINRYFPSTKLCHICGYKHNDLGLNIRHWVCPQCKTYHDRDVNAAINILNEGIRVYYSEYITP